MPSSIDHLMMRLDSLSIGDLPPFCAPDTVITEHMIASAYKTFHTDVKGIFVVASAAPTVLQSSFASAFTNAFSAFCNPYRKRMHAIELQISNLHAEKEAVRADTSEKLLGVTKDLTATLYEKLDQEPVTQISVPGSVSRRETWEKVKTASGTVMDSILPDYPDRRITNNVILPIVRQKYSGEPAMYIPVTRCVTQHLTISRNRSHPGTKVFDTHARFYLDGQAPDITITIQDLEVVDAASVIAIIELKAPSSVPMDSDCFGQVYYYLRKLSHTQPNRRKIVGLLSNLVQNHIIIHETPSQGVVNIIHFATTGFAKALRYIKHCILHDPITLPSIPSFSADLGRLERRLGNPALSVVGVFSYPQSFTSATRWIAPNTPSAGTKIVVKRTSYVPPRRRALTRGQNILPVRTPHPPSLDLPYPRSVASEIEILRAIHDSGRSPPRHMPALVYHSLGFNEFGMTPLGLSIDLHTISQVRARTVLEELLGVLNWLHRGRIIHRDVRWDNVIWAPAGYAVLVDFGAAIFEDDTYRPYEGGIICAPRRVIGDFESEYRAEPADDCAAWVLLVNALLSPTRWAGIRSEQIPVQGTREQIRMQCLWETLEKSSVWGPGVEAAKQLDYNGMLQLLDLVVLL